VLLTNVLPAVHQVAKKQGIGTASSSSGASLTSFPVQFNQSLLSGSFQNWTDVCSELLRLVPAADSTSPVAGKID
jgi:hypothetical protein